MPADPNAIDASTDQSEKLLPQKTSIDYKTFGVFCIFIFPALGGFLFGYDIGSTSLVISQLKDEDHSGVDWYHKMEDPVLQSALTVSSIAGAFIGSVLVFPVADSLGRRRELIFGAFLYIIGAMLSTASSFLVSNAAAGLTLIFVGRWIYGIGIGFVMHAAPSYISEMAPPSLRGTLVAAKEGVIVFGILSGNLLGFLLENTTFGWRWIYCGQV